MSSEELLMRWMDARDESAFRELVSLHAPMVFATSKRILGNEFEAEEVTQECFETLATTRRPRGYLGAWLHRVATNRCLDRLRSAKRRVKRETAFVESGPKTAEPSWQDLYELVDEAIAALPAKQRDAITAYFLQGRSHVEIAGDFGITRQTVTSRVRQGIEGIRKQLRRRGVQVSAAGFVALMERNAIAAAIPASLTANLGKLALVGAAGAAASTVGIFGGSTVKAAALVAVVASIMGTYFFMGGIVGREADAVASAIVADTTPGIALAPVLAEQEPQSETNAVEPMQLAQGTEPPNGDTNLLDRILAEQQKQYEALGKRSYHFVVNGNYYFKSSQSRRPLWYEEIGDGAGSIWGDFEMGNPIVSRIFAVNNHEFVHILGRENPNANVIELVEPADLPNAAFEKQLLLRDKSTNGRPNRDAEGHFEMYRATDYLRLGIVLLDGLTLAQTIKLSPPDFRYGVETMKGPDGRDLLFIRRSNRIDESDASDSEIIVDPAVGYRVIAYIIRHVDGTVRRYTELHYREYEPGVFVPTHFRDRVFALDKPGPDLDTATIVANGIGEVANELFFDKAVTIGKLELDYATTPERFTWKSFGWEEKDIFVMSRDGSTEVHLIENGELVPRKQVRGY